MARKKLADRRVLLYNLHWIDYYGWYGRARDIDDGTEFIVRSDANGIGLYAARKDCHFYENRRYDMLQWGVDLGKGEGREAYGKARKAIIETLNRLNVRVMKKKKRQGAKVKDKNTRIKDKNIRARDAGARGREQFWAESKGAATCPSTWSRSTLSLTADREAVMKSMLRANFNGLRPASKKRASGNG